MKKHYSARPSTVKASKKVIADRQMGGKWYNGIIDGFKWQALIFDEPSHFGIDLSEFGYEDQDYWDENNGSSGKISKLWVGDEQSGETIINYDRGWDILPADEFAQGLFDAVIAELIPYL